MESLFCHCHEYSKICNPSSEHIQPKDTTAGRRDGGIESMKRGRKRRTGGQGRIGGKKSTLRLRSEGSAVRDRTNKNKKHQHHKHIYQHYMTGNTIDLQKVECHRVNRIEPEDLDLLRL